MAEFEQFVVSHFELSIFHFPIHLRLSHVSEFPISIFQFRFSKLEVSSSTMDYGFTEYQTAIRDLAREIAEKEIRPIAAEYDREAKFPWPVVKVLAETDLFRVFIDDEYGGIRTARPS